MSWVYSMLIHHCTEIVQGAETMPVASCNMTAIHCLPTDDRSLTCFSEMSSMSVCLLSETPDDRFHYASEQLPSSMFMSPL